MAIFEPLDIKRFFDRPGRCWMSEERLRVEEWLFEDRQLRYLLYFALRHLRCTGEDYVRQEDAEDVLVEFYIKRLRKVIVRYNPTKGRRFWNFLLFCFERFCHDEGEKIRKRREREESLAAAAQTEEGEFIEIEVADDYPHAGERVLLEEKESEYERQCEVVQKCVNTLLPHYRMVVLMFYFEDKSIAEIAVDLDISETSVKVRLFRARQKLRRCLEKEGWIS